MKNLIKSTVYKVKPYSLPSALKLQIGYIFHTENVFDEVLFNSLLTFCKEYKKLTGKKPVCTVMAGTSPKVKAAFEKYSCTDLVLAERYIYLSEFATLGYHGHFYFNTDLYYRKESEIRSNNFSAVNLKEQVLRDLNWFTTYKLNHNGIYAGGWWFMNQYLLELLMKEGFKYDFSFSKSPQFRNQFSHKLMVEQTIKTGEPFEIYIPGKGSVKEIQNFIGAHSTPFIEDFYRVFASILDNDYHNLTGVLNSHDYDLDPENTLKVITDLVKLDNVTFFDAGDLISDSLKLSYKKVTLSAQENS